VRFAIRTLGPAPLPPRNLRLAARRLLRSPGFSLAALVTLALGIGAATLVFSVVDRVVVRPLPYPDPDRLVAVWWSGSITRGEYSVVRREATTLERVGLWMATDGFNLASDGGAVRVSATRVTPSLLQLLGVRPAAGRLFRPEETEVGRDRVVLLGYGFWEERFGASSDAVGSTLRLDGETHRIVGVLPEDYAFTDPDDHLLLPVQLEGVADGPLWGFGGYQAVGRTTPGTTPEEATAELRDLARVMRTENPVWTPAEGVRAESRVVDLRAAMVGDTGAMLMLLLGAVGVLLLVVCANVGNLLLTRGVARSGESAVRAALGAGRKELVRDHVAEGLLLSVGGCAGGILLAVIGLEVLGTPLASELPRGSEIGLDGRVLAVSLLLSAGTGLLASLAPALRSSAIPPADVLRDSGRGAGAARLRGTLSRVLVTAQVAAAAALLVGGALLGRSLAAMSSVDPGFHPEGVLTARVTLSGARYAEPGPRLAYLERLRDGLTALPGVHSVGLAGSIPFGVMGMGVAMRAEGVTTNPNELPVLDHYPIGPEYLGTLGIPVVEGRGIEPTDSWGSRPAALLDVTAARLLWPDESAVGKRVGWPYGDAPWLTVVGVVGAVGDDEITAAPTPTVYTSFAQRTPEAASMVIRFDAAAPASPASSLRALAAELDPAVTVSRVAPYPDLLAGSYARARLMASIVLLFAGVTLVLGCLGVYGVAAYAVRERTREIGIRMALGAEGGRIRAAVVREGLATVGPGLGLGILLALPLARVLSAFLFRVRPLDPLAFAAAPLLLAGVALLAVWLPARRATRVDPARVLQGG
jgi:putative ABC transport system permease protein